MRLPWRLAAVTLAFGWVATAGAAPPLPPLPAGWPAQLHLGVADPAGGAPALAATTPFGFRYHYLAGGVNTADGWANWDPSFVRDYVQESVAAGLLPVFTYYNLLQSAPGHAEGEPTALGTNLGNRDTMTAYYRDLARFFGEAAAFPDRRIVLHAEPDFWGHVQQQLGDGGASVFVHVGSTGLPELAGLPDTIAGLAGAFRRLRDLHAPNVLLAYHLSAWGPNRDFRGRDDAEVDELARRAAAFLASLDPGFDLVFAEFSDRDAGFKEHVEGDGGAAWWRPDDFDRHVRFLSTFVAAAGRRVVLWQVPLGNTRMRAANNTWNHYQDNRVQWLLDDPTRTHLDAYRQAGVVGFLFGRGAPGATCACDADGDGVTNPPPINGNVGLSLSGDDDGGFFRHKAAEYYAVGAMRLPDDGGADVVLALDAGRASVGPGEILELALTVGNPGPADVADVYFGIRLPAAAGPDLGCPGGDAVVWLADAFARVEVACLDSPIDRLPSLLRSAAVPAALPPTELPGFLRGGLPPGPVAAGEYVAFLVLTAPGAAADGRIEPGEVRALATARFTVTP